MRNIIDYFIHLFRFKNPLCNLYLIIITRLSFTYILLECRLIESHIAAYIIDIIKARLARGCERSARVLRSPHFNSMPSFSSLFRLYKSRFIRFILQINLLETVSKAILLKSPTFQFKCSIVSLYQLHDTSLKPH